MIKTEFGIIDDFNEKMIIPDIIPTSTIVLP
jgi:hypothetical protein